MELTHHQDPGHGWVFVDNETLKDLGLNRGSFSRYSYSDSLGVYAEEDSDAGIVIDAMKKQGISFTIKETHRKDAYNQDGDHWIRGLQGCRT